MESESDDNCISMYTSETHIKRYLRKKEKEHLSSPELDIKSNRRSILPLFVWKENCLFCGEKCDVEKDKKHPDHWRV